MNFANDFVAPFYGLAYWLLRSSWGSLQAGSLESALTSRRHCHVAFTSSAILPVRFSRNSVPKDRQHPCLLTGTTALSGLAPTAALHFSNRSSLIPATGSR